MTTPTGVLLGTYTPGTPEWQAARAGLCITATEIAAVLGLSPWQSRFSLWHKKAGLPTAPFQPSVAMEWGIRHEPTVAAKYAEMHPELTLTETGTWRHAEREWQRATPDRVGDDRLVEIKTATVDDDWGEPGTDEVPIYYRCQVMQQMDVLGYRRTDIALLVGNCDYREYTVWFDEDDAKVMRDAAVRFLDDVRTGNRPPIDGADATYQTIRVQPDGLEDRDVQIPAQLAARYETAQQHAKDAGTELTQVRGELLDLLGNAKRAVVGDRRIAYRTVREDGTTHSLQPYRSTT
ncbi:YqaJ viral recombinase family nuclease [Streptomyces pacificus]|uniref:YqaJ viral recombinase family nuclease n=1 Tax=Streptomyces pacificus TaxID=2705029 RepID=UPI0020B17636|nr:YqaJ viral recombinase family protein [Streptomyces pacificus]